MTWDDDTSPASAAARRRQRLIDQRVHALSARVRLLERLVLLAVGGLAIVAAALMQHVGWWMVKHVQLKIKAPKRVTRLRAVGVVVVVASAAATAALGDDYPWIAAVNSALCWAVGKLLAVPVSDVIAAALAAMSTDRAVAVTAQALRSMPPEKAEGTARSILASIPPDAARRLSGAHLVILPDSDPPPPSPPPRPPPPHDG